MAKIERIKDGRNTIAPLLVTRRKAWHGGVSPRDWLAPSMRVRSDSSESLVIYHVENPHGDINWDTLEINGVGGTIDQWRKVFLPLLGMEVPTA